MSTDSDGWQVVTKDPFAATGTPPQLTVYVDGTGRINASADRALDKPDAVQFLANPEKNLVGIAPAADADGLDVFSVTRSSEGAGGDVRPRKALERIGVDIDAIDDTEKVSLDQDGDLLVADCAELLDDPAATHTGDRALDATTTAADHDTDEEDETETDEQLWCGICGAGPFDSTKRLAGHHNGSGHEGETVQLDHEPDSDEIRHSASEPTLALVRDHAESADTVQELAERLDVTDGRARMLARQAEVSDQLDEDVPPMGVSLE